MQSKISTFFKPSSHSASALTGLSLALEDSNVDDDGLSFWLKKENVFINTYKRRTEKSNRRQSVSSDVLNDEQLYEPSAGDHFPRPEQSNTEKIINKNRKRSYEQLHLEFGQSDFHFHTCSICGLRYSPGVKVDESFHKTFHNNYMNGIQFKGWHNERVVYMPSPGSGRIILVLDKDPLAHRSKVHEVIKVMETDLGCGWIFHESCKVYLFVSSHRIIGCLVAEPIKEAFKVLPSSIDERSYSTTQRERKSVTTTLKFGEILFHREILRKAPSAVDSGMLDENMNRAIFCEKDAIPAVCGIRAIWVAPSSRRKHIATQLLDTMRRNFCTGFVLEKSHLAFSQPTPAGKSLATHYIGTESFLVYKANGSDS